MYKIYKDPKEQRRLVEKLLQVWTGKAYDWRFCQLISNLHGAGSQDIFHTSDNKLEDLVDKVLKEGWE